MRKAFKRASLFMQNGMIFFEVIPFPTGQAGIKS